MFQGPFLPSPGHARLTSNRNNGADYGGRFPRFDTSTSSMVVLGLGGLFRNVLVPATAVGPWVRSFVDRSCQSHQTRSIMEWWK